MPIVRPAAVVRGASIVRPGLVSMWVSFAILGLTTGPAYAQTEAPDGPPSASPPADSEGEVSAARREPAPKSRFFLSVAGGYAYQNLYGVSIGGGDIDVVLGAESAQLTIGADIEAVGGSTEYGLATTELTFGLLLEAHFDRFRVGGGARLGAFNVERATDTGGLFASSEGVYARASFDLFHSDLGKSTIFLFVKGSADSVGGALLGAVGGIGMRF
jgi:hypothetical protein